MNFLKLLILASIVVGLRAEAANPSGHFICKPYISDFYYLAAVSSGKLTFYNVGDLVEKKAVDHTKDFGDFERAELKESELEEGILRTYESCLDDNICKKIQLSKFEDNHFRMTALYTKKQATIVRGYAASLYRVHYNCKQLEP